VKSWNAKKKKIWKYAVALTSRAAGRASAATALPTTFKKGSYRGVFSRKTPKKPTTGPLSILPNWWLKSRYEPVQQTAEYPTSVRNSSSIRQFPKRVLIFLDSRLRNLKVTSRE